MFVVDGDNNVELQEVAHDSLYNTALSNVLNFLEHYDDMLTKTEAYKQYDNYISERPVTDYLLININNEPTLYTEYELAEYVGNYITTQVRDIIISEHIREKKLVVSKQNMMNNSELSEGCIAEISAMPLEVYFNKNWAYEIVGDYTSELLGAVSAEALSTIDKLIDSLKNHTPWNLAEEEKEQFSSKNSDAFFDVLDQIIKHINRMSNNLPDYLLSRVKSAPNLVKRIKDQAVSDFRVDAEIIKAKYLTVTELPISRKERKAKKKAAYLSGKTALEQTVVLKYDEQPIDVEVQTVTTPDNFEEEMKAYEELGDFFLYMPWMPDNEKLNTRIYRGRNQDVFMVKALSNKLKKISSEVRDGLPKNADGEDKIDLKIKQIIKRISEGIMPYENTNSVKSLATDSKDLSAAYSEESIWYSFDISPNAPRIYFTVRETPEELKNYSDRESKMVIILAEADKARQLDTLTTLTTLSSTTLRARGAGSI